MSFSAALAILFLTAALILALVGSLFPNRRLLRLVEKDLTFILETLAAIVNELERVRIWIRSLELEAEKKESGG